jgi:hypothetical protein
MNANFAATRAVVNGNLDNSNLATAAGIVDTKLASPNNSVYREIMCVTANFLPANGAQTYWFDTGDSGPQTTTVNGNFSLIPVRYFAAADYATTDKTQKLRVRAQCLVSGAAPARTFTCGLYEITAVTNGANGVAPTLAASPVSGSTAAFASPGNQQPQPSQLWRFHDPGRQLLHARAGAVGCSRRVVPHPDFDSAPDPPRLSAELVDASGDGEEGVLVGVQGD